MILTPNVDGSCFGTTPLAFLLAVWYNGSSLIVKVYYE